MVIKAIKQWWVNLNKDPIEKYLSESVDLVDLENRQRDLQRKGIWI
jgi:hypothetical protein